MDEQIFEALVEEFYLESCERLSKIEQALMAMRKAESTEWDELLVETKRELHTIKGNSGMMGLRELQGQAHRLEDRVVEMESAELIPALLLDVDDLQKKLDADCGQDQSEAGDEEGDLFTLSAGVQNSVRVSFAALDSLVELLSEMVIFRNRLSEAMGKGLSGLSRRDRASTTWREVEGAHETLEKTLEVIQGEVMQLRMVPMESLLSQQKRVVFDEAEREGKLVEIRTSGGDTPLDKALLEVASDALGHIVRNAVVHGLETPEERAAAGKSETGHLEVRAQASSEEVVLEIEDDGRGIDLEVLRQRAEEQGHEITESTDPLALLALPGLSTKVSADASSGRGMGMSAVVESIRRGGGQLEVASQPGQGTRFRLRLPLSAAIVRALILAVDDELFALPAVAVREAVSLDIGQRYHLSGTGVLRWRGDLIPLVDLGLTFETSPSARESGQVIFVESEGRYRGLVVDSIVGIRDIVVKGLGKIVGAPFGVTGCTILGDGRVVLILDPRGLTKVNQRIEGISTEADS